MTYLQRLRVALATALLGPEYICPIDGTAYRTRCTLRNATRTGRYVWARHRRCASGKDQQHCYPLGRVWQPVEIEG